MRQCLLIDSPELTAFKCQNEPIYVLSRTCTDEYYGAAGPCCKVDVALNWLVNIQTELFSHIKFLLHCDDDMYWRPLQTLRWLASVQNSGANMYPLVANAKDADVNSHGVWHIENCKEIHTSGWYQPLMLNHIALQMIGPAAAAYGVRDTCTAFDVTHDVGIGIFFWLYGLFHIQMPFTGINPSHKGVALLKPTDMAMHCIKHSNSEAECSEWKGEDRYKQNKVVGCGDVGEPSPHHDRAAMADMYDAHAYYEHSGAPIVLEGASAGYTTSWAVVDASNSVQHIIDEKFKVAEGQVGTFELITGEMYVLKEGERVTEAVFPRLWRLHGYAATQHSREHNVAKAWTPFTMKDCSPPGNVRKKGGG